MAWTDLFRRKGEDSAGKPMLSTAAQAGGLRIAFANPLTASTPEALFDAANEAPVQDAFLATYAAQLGQEGLCLIDINGVTLPWQQVYSLAKLPEHAGAINELDLPPEMALQPIIDCKGILSDPDFELQIVGWAQGDQSVEVQGLIGAFAVVAGESVLLPEAAWATANAIAGFKARSGDERTRHAHELAWGHIRQLATHAGAFYQSPYLQTTIVLTPQTLRLPMTKEEVVGVRVLTVAPTFDDAPEEWLSTFDRYGDVQDHYDLTRGGGLVRVVLSEPVKRVLRVVKREMPGRRVAGARAERFMHNPWAYLGDTAQEVINEEDFLNDKAAAGGLSAAFIIVPRSDGGRIERVDLIVSEMFVDGSGRTEIRHFPDPSELNTFVGKLEQALRDEREWFTWGEYDLTIDGESTRQLEIARQIHFLWKSQSGKRIEFEEIYALANYSERIEGIGVAKPIYVPVFQKSSDRGEGNPIGIPTDLEPGVAIKIAGHEGRVLIPLTRIWVAEFEQQVEAAERGDAASVRNTSLPTPVETGEARALVDAFKSMLTAQETVKTSQRAKGTKERPKREALLLKLNFHGVDYLEARKESLSVGEDQQPKLPKCLRPTVELKKHQIFGVAWFQHLISLAPFDCRGALLADDMGLGKTLQLLCVLARHYEENPEASPSLILAPKSLLDNWRKEVDRFFTPSFPEILVLYDGELMKRKQPLGLIDEQLQTRGVTELLRPGWLGNAKVLITTYEVLTGYEFSLAKQPFSFIICDEAQRIKTPGTRATLSVKALRADFRVACTGTPVENSLADLWCLFDLVQPGLLGGLEEFGQTYRRPIESNTPELQAALEKLKAAITPQTLRRTKADIAEELPRKLFAYAEATEDVLQFVDRLEAGMRLEVALSDHQVALYRGGLRRLQDANEERDGRKRARLSFDAFHLMKAVCAEPYCIPGRKFLVDERGVHAHLMNSRKMAWLLKTLEGIRASGKGDKVIVFTELREVQNALAYFLRQTFGLKPFIINGDTEGRQAYIDRFSESEGFNVIILSTLAAGAGLNVTAANHVFHFTRAWNPAKENQATDRAYRIGSTKDVFVYCPVMVTEAFTTFEVRLDEMMNRKAKLFDATLGGSDMVGMLDGTGAADISIKDLVGDGKLGEAEMLKERALTMDDVDRMDGLSFEFFCKLLWEKRGFVSSVTPKKGGDGGIDVVAQLGRDGQLLQCKTSIHSEIGWDAIKEVVAGAVRYQTRFFGTRFSKVAVTNQRFTSGAREQAEANRVNLVERDELASLLQKYSVTNYDLDEEL
ncbi:MAG: SNF2-related protein [Nitrospirota bacterium]|nr:SNF2-related protein [Nitrospirota bacterium]